MVLQGSLTVEGAEGLQGVHLEESSSAYLQHGPSPFHNTWRHHDLAPTAPPSHLTNKPQDWGLSFTGAFVASIELKKLLPSGPSHSFEYPAMQSFSQEPFEESKLLSYIWPVAATILQRDL